MNRLTMIVAVMIAILGLVVGSPASNVNVNIITCLTQNKRIAQDTTLKVDLLHSGLITMSRWDMSNRLTIETWQARFRIVLVLQTSIQHSPISAKSLVNGLYKNLRTICFCSNSMLFNFTNN